MGLSLHSSRFALAAYKFNVWDVILPAGEEFENCLKPAYWAHVASKLKIGDEVRVTDDEGKVYARLYVRMADRLWAQMVVLERVDLAQAEVQAVDEGDYHVDVEFAGRYDKHRVIRMRGGVKETLSKGHETRESAQKWADDHLKTIGKKAA